MPDTAVGKLFSSSVCLFVVKAFAGRGDAVGRIPVRENGGREATTFSTIQDLWTSTKTTYDTSR